MTCGSARQPMVTVAVRYARSPAPPSAARAGGATCPRVCRRPRSGDVQLAPLLAERRAPRAQRVQRLRPRRACSGCGLRISSVSVAENTLAERVDVLQLGGDRGLGAPRLALISASNLVQLARPARARADRRPRARSPARSARPITSAASRTSPRSVRVSSAAGSRSNDGARRPVLAARGRARASPARGRRTRRRCRSRRRRGGARGAPAPAPPPSERRGRADRRRRSHCW